MRFEKCFVIRKHLDHMFCFVRVFTGKDFAFARPFGQVYFAPIITFNCLDFIPAVPRGYIKASQDHVICFAVGKIPPMKVYSYVAKIT